MLVSPCLGRVVGWGRWLTFCITVKVIDASKSLLGAGGRVGCCSTFCITVTAKVTDVSKPCPGSGRFDGVGWVVVWVVVVVVEVGAPDYASLPRSPMPVHHYFERQKIDR